MSLAKLRSHELASGSDEQMWRKATSLCEGAKRLSNGTANDGYSDEKMHPMSHCNPWQTVLAAPNKYLALSNKSCMGGEATKKRESSVSLQAKRDDKRRASGRPDLPSGDVGLHSRRGRLRRDRVTP